MQMKDSVSQELIYGFLGFNYKLSVFMHLNHNLNHRGKILTTYLTENLFIT